MHRLRTAVVFALLTGGYHVVLAKPAVVFEFWMNALLPEDLQHFDSIKGPTKAITVTITHPGTGAVKRQRVDIKGDFRVDQVTTLLQAILGADESYWKVRGPLGVGVVGDAHRAVIKTSWGSGSADGSGSSYVYTLENGMWRYLYNCCRDANQ